jgi:hypothetical protein
VTFQALHRITPEEPIICADRSMKRLGDDVLAENASVRIPGMNSVFED